MTVFERQPNFQPPLRGYEMRNKLRFACTQEEKAEFLDGQWNDYTWRRRHGVSIYYPRIEFLLEKRDARPMCFGQEIAFNWGEFDRNAAVAYRLEADGRVYVAFASDKYYFEILAWFRDMFGAWRVWCDVRRIYYAMVGQKRVEEFMAALCGEIAGSYPVDVREAMYNALMHLYYGMVAEELKLGTVLGRRIKLQGLALLLVFGWTPEAAADWSRDKDCVVIDAFVQEVGIVPDDRERVLSEEERKSIIAKYNENVRCSA